MKELLSENVPDEYLGRLVIKEVVGGVPIKITLRKSEILTADNNPQVSLLVESENAEAEEHVRQFGNIFKAVATAFDSMEIEAKWVDPNPLNGPPVQIEHVKITKDGQTAFVSDGSIENLSSRIGWITPILRPVPICLVMALTGSDDETVRDIRARMRAYPSLIRESSHEPEYRAIVFPAFREEERGMEWVI